MKPTAKTGDGKPTLAEWGEQKRLGLIASPITERMIDMGKIVCDARRTYVVPKGKELGAWFACALPIGHKGDHILRPTWETFAALRFAIGAGYFSEASTTATATRSALAAKLRRAVDDMGISFRSGFKWNMEAALEIETVANALESAQATKTHDDLRRKVEAKFAEARKVKMVPELMKLAIQEKGEQGAYQLLMDSLLSALEPEILALLSPNPADTERVG